MASSLVEHMIFRNWCTMSEPALRSFAVAGVLAATLAFSGLGAPPAFADEPGETGGSSQESGDTGGESEQPGGNEAVPNESDEPAEPPASGPAEEPHQPEVDPPREADPGDAGGGGDSGGRDEQVPESPEPAPAYTPPYRNSITLPFIRLPAAGEIPFGSWPTVSTFYTTKQIPVPTLGEFLRSLQYVPTPAPAPGPQFRTQDEAPVADATTGTTGGRGGGGGGVMSEPTVFRAPLVTVPRAVTIAGKPPRATPGAPAGAPVPPGVTAPGVAGVRTPAIRGSVPPTPGVSTPPASTPLGGTPTTGAYPRGVMNPAMAEIAAVALPGVAGLLFLTFSGGLIGYRQANSVRYVRTAGAERFLP